MLIRVCSTVIHPREVLTPSKSSPGTVYTTVTPSILNDSFCDCPGFQYRGGRCSHVQREELNRCEWYGTPAANYATIMKCPDCGSPVEDFETRSEFV